MVTYYVSLLLKMFKPQVITHYGYACESITIIHTEWAKAMITLYPVVQE